MARTSYLKPALYNKLYAAMQYENALALRTCLETGWRIDDVLHLKLSDLQGRTLSCIAMKTGKSDKKVISADLAGRLRRIASNGRIFDGRFGTKPRTRQAVWQDVKKASQRLGIAGNIAPHSARKTYAVQDFRDNGLAQVQKDLQHDRLSTTLVYAFADLLTASDARGAPCGLRSNTANLSQAPTKQDAPVHSEAPNGAPQGTDSGRRNAQASEPWFTSAARPTDFSSFAVFADYIAVKVAERIEPLILGLTKNL